MNRKFRNNFFKFFFDQVPFKCNVSVCGGPPCRSRSQLLGFGQSCVDELVMDTEVSIALKRVALAVDKQSDPLDGDKS